VQKTGILVQKPAQTIIRKENRHMQATHKAPAIAPPSTHPAIQVMKRPDSPGLLRRQVLTNGNTQVMNQVAAEIHQELFRNIAQSNGDTEITYTMPTPDGTVAAKKMVNITDFFTNDVENIGTQISGLQDEERFKFTKLLETAKAVINKDPLVTAFFEQKDPPYLVLQHRVYQKLGQV